MRMNEDNKKRKNLSPLSTYCCPALWSSGSGGVGTSGGWAGLKTWDVLKVPMGAVRS